MENVKIRIDLDAEFISSLQLILNEASPGDRLVLEQTKWGPVAILTRPNRALGVEFAD